MESQATNSQWCGLSAAHCLRWVLAAVFVVLFINTAWVSDDAYIILRTADNFLHGHGLRWNVAERVQSFTCPLWALVLCGGCGVTGEYYCTTVALSFLLATGTVYLVGWRLAAGAWAGIAGLAALVSSKAFMDYTSSGLENTMGYFLLALFLLVYSRPLSLKNLFLMSLATGLAMANRMDVALLLGFPLLYSAYGAWGGSQESGVRGQGAGVRGRDSGLRPPDSGLRVPVSGLRTPASGFRPRLLALLRLSGVVALGMLPFLAWEIFSIIYYGFPFPNTAYAKLHTGIPAHKLIYRGYLYGLDSLARDPLTLLVIGAVSATVAIRGGWRQRWAVAGIGAYLLYIVWVGGDFMSGRFFSLPFLAACAVAVRFPSAADALPVRPARAVMPLGRGFLGMTALACLGLGLFAERPTFVAGPSYENKRRPNYIADERGYYYQWTGLWPVLRNGGEPRGAWVDAGKALRAAGAGVVLGDSVGLTGFYAGPAVHIVDRLALSDPLLARMEVPSKGHWRVGHYERRVPAGYLDSLRTGENRIEEAGPRQLHDVLAGIVRGPIWSARRFREIGRINRGHYDELMKEK